jgi:phosphohistidine phosphatase
MKKLIIVRHSKAERTGIADIERKLTDEGKTDAGETGKLLKQNNVKPDIIISSPANRALKTSKIIAKKLHFPKEKIIEQMELFTDGAHEIVQLLRNVDNDFNTVMIVGHNPVLLETINALHDEGLDALHTSEAVNMEFEVMEWSEISPATCTKVQSL